MKQAITKLVFSLVFTSGLVAQVANNAATLYNVSTVAGSVPSGQGNGGPANQALFLETDGIAVDPSGNIYVSDSVRGNIRKIAAGTGIITNYLALNTTIFGLATDSAGNVYAAVAGWHAIIKCGPNCNPAGVLATTALPFSSGSYVYLAGNSGHNSGFAGDGGQAVQLTTSNLRELNTPHGVAVDAAGNLYIADTSNNRIRKVDTAGIIHTIAGTGASVAPIVAGASVTCAAATDIVGDGCQATQAILNGPWGVTVDPLGSGTIYIADTGNNRIRAINPATGVITTIGGNGNATVLTGVYTGGLTNVSLGDGNAATTATFKSPFYIAIDANGNMFVADNGNTRVRKISNGTVLSYGATNTNGNGVVSTSFTSPRQIAIDANGNLLVADGTQIKSIDPNYLVSTPIIGRAAFAGDGGPANSALLNGAATGLAVDSAGDIFISDASNNRIREVMGGTINTIIGNGTAASYTTPTATVAFSTTSGDNGPINIARVNAPGCLAVDANNNLYIADKGDNRIRRVTNGVITTIVGPSLGSGVTTPYAIAVLNGPTCVAVDSTGTNVYFTEGNSVQKVNQVTGVVTVVAGQPSFLGAATTSTTTPSTGPGGISPFPVSTTTTVTTLGGNTVTSGAAGNDGDGTPAVNALLNAPTALAVDSAGNVFIADKSNNEIREVSAATGIITTIAGVSSTTGGDNSTINFTTGAITTVQPAFGARLNAPAGVAVDNFGNIYIANTGNGTIQKINPAGAMILIAGGGNTLNETGVSIVTSTPSGTIVGNGTQILSPSAIAVDSQGNVYFSDRVGLVRKLTPVM